MAAVLAALALSLGLAGCGDGGDQAEPTTSAPATTITVSRFDGERPTGSRELDCAPGAAACARVVALLPELRPTPGEVCTQLYGGPERIVLEGTVDGDPLRLEVTRVDGCAIARYDRLEAALREG